MLIECTLSILLNENFYVKKEFISCILNHISVNSNVYVKGFHLY